MNTKQEKLLAFSLGALLLVSVVGISQSSFVFADKDEGKDKDYKKDKDNKQKFSKKPDLQTEQCFLTPDAQSNLPSLDGVDCKAKAWFDKTGTSLKYRIEVNGMDVTGSDGDSSDDIGKMHFHKAMMFMPSGEPMGPMHVLNIFKQPAQDDDDLVIKPIQGIFRGIWEDSDAVDREGNDDDTKTVTEMQSDLCHGNVFLMVHGTVINGDGSVSKPGYLKAVLKATSEGEKFCEKKLGIS